MKKQQLILTNIVPFRYKNKFLRTTKFINIIIVLSNETFSPKYIGLKTQSSR